MLLNGEIIDGTDNSVSLKGSKKKQTEGEGGHEIFIN